MKKTTYLSPKNNVTEILKHRLENFAGYIDKFKNDSDCITINKIDISLIDQIIIYSPQYYKEICAEFQVYVPAKKIVFYIGFGQTTRSQTLASYIYEITKKWAKIKKRIKNYGKRSETSKVRDILAPFCSGNGIDIGFGGDPILKSSITIDLPSPYAQYETNPLHLRGSGDNLYWFNEGVLDYVYSSHLLEDFEKTEEVMNEWLRVIKLGGHLVLFLPNEQIYRKYCKQKGVPSNPYHIHEHFGLEYVLNLIQDRNDIEVIHQKEPSCIYSFELVLKKIK